MKPLEISPETTSAILTEISSMITEWIPTTPGRIPSVLSQAIYPKNAFGIPSGMLAGIHHDPFPLSVSSRNLKSTDNLSRRSFCLGLRLRSFHVKNRSMICGGIFQ